MDNDKAPNIILLRFAGITLLIALVLAWLLIFSLPLKMEVVTNIFKDTDRLLSSHLDYLMMTMLLLGIYAARVPLPKIVCYATCIGSITNPLMFLLMSMYPTSLGLPFLLSAVTSSVITTFGYGMSAIILFRSTLARNA